jgi:hypothetical protein
MAHEGVPLVVIQRQLGHANLGITSIYLQGIDSSEIIHTVHSRPAPVMPSQRRPRIEALNRTRGGWAMATRPLSVHSEPRGGDDDMRAV